MAIDGRKIVTLLMAAGSSTRMGAAGSKALMSICGVPVIQRSLDAIRAATAVDRVVVLIPMGMQAEFASVCKSDLDLDFVVGDTFRQGSVFRGLKFCKENLKMEDASLVMIHDAARCLVSPLSIRSVLEAAMISGAATLALPVVDSVIEVNKPLARLVVSSYQDRNKTYLVQTPQVFRFDLLWRAHHSSVRTATDDASLVMPICQVSVVEGLRSNFKITTPEDLAIAESLLKLS